MLSNGNRTRSVPPPARSRLQPSHLACGLLRETTSAAAKLVFDGPHITRECGEQLIEMVLAKAAVTGAEDHIPLRGVMMGIGGRSKPWGA